MAIIHPAILPSVFVITSPETEAGPRTQGSGFIIARPDDMPYTPWNEKESAKTAANWHFYAVSCRHVVEDTVRGEGKGPIIHMNPAEIRGGVKYIRYESNKEEWMLNDKEDIAVYDIGKLVTHEIKISMWAWKPENQLLREAMNRENVWEGNGIITIGFPEGWGYMTPEGHHPIVRHGIIAQARPYLDGAQNTFLIDSNSYSGNSGGPVITLPTIHDVGGTKAHNRTSLIGMICASSQAQRAEGWWDGRRLHRLRETSGLGVVVGAEAVHQTIDELIKFQGREANGTAKEYTQ